MPTLREISKDIRRSHRTSILICMLGSAMCGGIGTVLGLLLGAKYDVPREWWIAFFLSVAITGWSFFEWMKRDESMDDGWRVP